MYSVVVLLMIVLCNTYDVINFIIIIFECMCVCSYRLNLGIIVIKYKINIMTLPITKVTTHYYLFIMTKRTVKN